MSSYGPKMCVVVITLLMSGCAASYRGIVRPVPQLAALSPELENLTDARIETYLKANARPVFPSVLAVAKIGSGHKLLILRGEEAEGWQKLASLHDKGAGIISQVHLLGSLLVNGEPSLKQLRDAAARVHAPLLLVYMQTDDAEDGYNDAAMAYWSIVGLFLVPGNTVGRYSVCQAVLVDTRTGTVLATAGGEAQREENVLYGAVDIARKRTAEEAQSEAVSKLQGEVSEALAGLWRSSRLASGKP